MAIQNLVPVQIICYMLNCFIRCVFLYFTVPEGPPLLVEVEALSSDALRVTWEVRIILLTQKQLNYNT